MAVKKWEAIQLRYCEHAGSKVALEAQVVYPAEVLPEQPGRVLAHRCSHGVRCMLVSTPSCKWSGSNPAFDPFLEANL